MLFLGMTKFNLPPRLFRLLTSVGAVLVWVLFFAGHSPEKSQKPSGPQPFTAPQIVSEIPDSVANEKESHPNWVEKIAARDQAWENSPQPNHTNGEAIIHSTTPNHDRNWALGIALGAIGLGSLFGRRQLRKGKRRKGKKDRKDVPWAIISILNTLGILLIIAFALIAPPLLGSILIGLPSIVFGKLFLVYLFTILVSLVLVGLANLGLFLALPRNKDNAIVYILFNILLFIPIAFFIGPFSLLFFLQWILSIQIGFGFGLLLSLSTAIIYLFSILLVTTTGLA